jgi:ATP-binding cassette subfamily C (CFTR/MRP) protein 1
MIMALPLIAGGLASFQRIQDHINGKKRRDNRENLWGKKSSHMELSKSDKPLERPDTDEIAELDRDHESVGDGYELVEMVDTNASSADLGTDIIASVQGKFSWAEDSEPVINITEWKIRRRMVTVVFGPVGSGKSTLLQSLLGELSSFEGTIRTNYSGVAYCSQTPWIPNETVRNIITCGSNFDESWYHTIIKACALEQDIQNWPNGHDTEAGSNGITMSGGQKHRLVSLASEFLFHLHSND